MTFIRFPFLFLLLFALGSTPAFVQPAFSSVAGERYLASDAMADIADARRAAKENDKLLLVVMGANWCHDSRALAARLYTRPLSSLISEHYEVVFVDVGYLEKGRDVITSFGVPAYYATPTVLVVDPASGQLVNEGNRHQWANADLISMDDSVAYFRLMADTERPALQIENEPSPELEVLLDEIRVFEQGQANRLYDAYAVLSPLLKAYKDGEDDGSFQKTWTEVRKFRYQIPMDVAAMQTEATRRVSAGETGIRLDFPVYPPFHWEN